MNNKKLAVLCVAVFSVAAPALAQSDAPKPSGSPFYRLDFVIKEMEGSKAVKTHNYQMMAALIGGTSSIRSGARVPVVTDGKSTTYIDVGMSIDVHHLLATKDGLEFDIVAEASGTLDGGTAQPLSKQPMIYQTKWNSRIQLQPGQSATVFSSDDPSSKHQLQLEITATPIH
jgi:hypothetical protein